jgi:hypothetical protein
MTLTGSLRLMLPLVLAADIPQAAQQRDRLCRQASLEVQTPVRAVLWIPIPR